MARDTPAERIGHQRDSGAWVRVSQSAEYRDRADAYLPRFFLDSFTVVRGFFRTVLCFTKRPVIALRPCFEPPFPALRSHSNLPHAPYSSQNTNRVIHCGWAPRIAGAARRRYFLGRADVPVERQHGASEVTV